MDIDLFFVTAIYLGVSILGFLFWHSVIKYFSGDKFSEKWFWLCLIGVLLWGMAQYSVARHGSILFFSSPLEFLVKNDWVRWIAFISVLLQVACIPSKTPKRR